MKSLFFLLLITSVQAAFVPKSFQAKFIQKEVSITFNKERITNGHISYKFPGHLRFELIDEPKTQYVSNKTKSWYYQPPMQGIKGAKGELRIMTRGQTNYLTRFFDALRKGLVENNIYSVNQKGKNIELVFSKKYQQAMGLKKVTFPKVGKIKSVKSLKQIKEMILTKTDNKNLTLEFKDYKENISYSKNHFNFKTPENTNVTEM